MSDAYGTNANKVFTISTEGYLVNSGTSRFVGVFSSNDWRCYTSINSNITGQTFKFYKLFGEDPESGTQPTKYAINLASVTGGTITAKVGGSAVTEAEEGAVVTLEATADANFAFESWSVTGATVANASSATTTFTMGTSPVTVDATFTKGSGGSTTPTSVTYDFTDSSWSVSNGTLTDGSVSFTGEGAANFKMNSGYFILGKSGAYINFPEYQYPVTKIVVTGRSGASTSVKQNIFVGNTAVSTETTGATGANNYNIASASQSAGTIFTLKVTSAHNTQITKIEVFFGSGN